MRIIKKATPGAFRARNPQARTGLEHWYKTTKATAWTRLADARATFPHADPVAVRSGRKVVVFNIGGKKCRLITAIHYNRRLVFTLMVLTHAEYGKEEWKGVL
ncbi:MAG: type II toxin-antitoxin system HigB family toxin [Planctomycetes bacterium]|nr:type II toxin-antitoxin system HigB family toxin [Planctomycetota bacterium]